MRKHKWIMPLFVLIALAILVGACRGSTEEAPVPSSQTGSSEPAIITSPPTPVDRRARGVVRTDPIRRLDQRNALRGSKRLV